MTGIINKQLIGRGASEDKDCIPFELKEPIGHWIYKTLRKNLTKYGNMTWMTDLSTGRSMTYEQLVESVDRMGSALRKRGFRASDTVLVIANNHLEIVITYLAVWLLEGCSASISLYEYSDEIIRSKIMETGAKLILTDHQRNKRFQNVIKDLVGIEVIVLGGHADNCIFFDDLLSEGGIFELEECGEFNADLPVWLGFSSGTTGVPKGIIHAHSSFAIFHQMDGAISREKQLTTNGMIHGSGIIGIVANILGYGHQFIMSETVSGESILQGIHESKVTVVSIYPHEIAQICSLSPEITSKYDLSSVQILKVTGSHVLPIYRQRMAELIPNLIQLVNSYGQTELLALSSPLPRSPSRTAFLELLNSPLIESVGKVFPFVKLKFLDLVTGQNIGPNEIGEIVVKTPFIMKGYLYKPENLAKLIRDGWYCTGDVGYYDSDGNIFLLGRVSELIKFKSYYVAPFKIEQQMILHPAVKEVAVVGAPHDQDGERPTAFVVLKNPQDECETLLEEIKTFTNERVSDREKIEGSIHIIDRIPRSDAGKIFRYKLSKTSLKY